MVWFLKISFISIHLLYQHGISNSIVSIEYACGIHFLHDFISVYFSYRAILTVEKWHSIIQRNLNVVYVIWTLKQRYMLNGLGVCEVLSQCCRSGSELLCSLFWGLTKKNLKYLKMIKGTVIIFQASRLYWIPAELLMMIFSSAASIKILLLLKIEMYRDMYCKREAGWISQ